MAETGSHIKMLITPKYIKLVSSVLSKSKENDFFLSNDNFWIYKQMRRWYRESFREGSLEACWIEQLLNQAELTGFYALKSPLSNVENGSSLAPSILELQQK